MIKTYNKHSPEVYEFRKKIFIEDLNLPLETMNFTMKQLSQLGLDDEQLQNAYKMSNTKWDKENIDQVWMLPGIAISCGYEVDDTRYRGGYLAYTMKDKRAKFRSLHFKEFGFFFLQSLRAMELNKDKIIITVYEYNRRMAAQVRAYKHKGYADQAGNILHQELYYEGIEHIKNCDQHVFSIDFKKLWQKYDEDLMEMNNNEAPEISAKFATQPNQYPDVVKLKADFDVNKLHDEYKQFNDNENYIISRRKDFKISPSINVMISTYLGFKEKVYSGVALNKKNSIELKDSVGPYTKEFLTQFPSACRMNYITTRTGWKTKQHVDHTDYTKQGFRIIVPFGEMRMTFENEREYILEPGNVYFVNICTPHVGDHYSSQSERAGLLFKLTNDEQIWQAYSSV